MSYQSSDDIYGENNFTNYNESMSNVLSNYIASRNFTSTQEIVLIVIYASLIVLGLCTNLMVCVVIVKKSYMQNPRNLYIINLNISDMMMCIICMPFTLIWVLRREWFLGSLLCKLFPVLQGTNIMISIGTITMIALDRYLTIVRRHNTVSTKSSVICNIFRIWILSILATSPLAFYQNVEPLTPWKNSPVYYVCKETWSYPMRLGYTICILLIQAVIPASVVTIVHVRIASYLHTHTKSQATMRKAERDLQKNKKMTFLLLGIAVLFLISWLPLALFSLFSDIFFPPSKELLNVSVNNLYLTFTICHIIAMSSAITNPVVYGWLNSNIRQEFLKYLPLPKNKPTDDPTTTRTVIGTSTQRKSGPVTLQMKSERTERNTSPPNGHGDSIML